MRQGQKPMCTQVGATLRFRKGFLSPLRISNSQKIPLSVV